jgi:hypothetical protein
MEDILSKAKFLRITLSDAKTPYIIPWLLATETMLFTFTAPEKGRN